MSAPQGTADWLQERCGYITGSEFETIQGFTLKGVSTEKRTRYLLDKACERLTGKPVESGTFKEMQWGTNFEPDARYAYEQRFEVWPEEVGFQRKAGWEWVGSSPDALIGDDGLIEIKCPFYSHNHLETVLAGEIPAQYIAQVQGNLWVCERQWADFCSYDPRFVGQDGLELFVVRVNRDEQYIAKLEEAVRKALDEVDEILERTARRMDGVAGLLELSVERAKREKEGA